MCNALCKQKTGFGPEVLTVKILTEEAAAVAARVIGRTC